MWTVSGLCSFLGIVKGWHFMKQNTFSALESIFCCLNSFQIRQRKKKNKTPQPCHFVWRYLSLKMSWLGSCSDLEGIGMSHTQLRVQLFSLYIVHIFIFTSCFSFHSCCLEMEGQISFALLFLRQLAANSYQWYSTLVNLSERKQLIIQRGI